MFRLAARVMNKDVKVLRSYSWVCSRLSVRLSVCHSCMQSGVDLTSTATRRHDLWTLSVVNTLLHNNTLCRLTRILFASRRKRSSDGSNNQIIESVFTARRYAKRGICRRRVSVCLSVLCLSHSGIVWKRLNGGSRKQHRTIAPGL